MSCEETEGMGTAREGKGVRGVEGQWAPTSVSAATEAVALGKAMDIQKWQGGHVGDGVHKQVYAMSCLSDVSRHICSQQD